MKSKKNNKIICFLEFIHRNTIFAAKLQKTSSLHGLVAWLVACSLHARCMGNTRARSTLDALEWKATVFLELAVSSTLLGSPNYESGSLNYDSTGCKRAKRNLPRRKSKSTKITVQQRHRSPSTRESISFFAYAASQDQLR